MSILDRLLHRFRNRDYRRSYADGFTDSYLATQIRVLREQRGLTQAMLADAVGMKQSQVSRLENVDNSSGQVRTLKRLAEAFDLALVVRFESFGKVLPEIIDFNRVALQRPSFADDPAFVEIPLVEENTVAGRAEIKFEGMTVSGSGTVTTTEQLFETRLRGGRDGAQHQIYDSLGQYANAA